MFPGRNCKASWHRYIYVSRVKVKSMLACSEPSVEWMMWDSIHSRVDLSGQSGRCSATQIYQCASSIYSILRLKDDYSTTAAASAEDWNLGESYSLSDGNITEVFNECRLKLSSRKLVVEWVSLRSRIKAVTWKLINAVLCSSFFLLFSSLLFPLRACVRACVCVLLLIVSAPQSQSSSKHDARNRSLLSFYISRKQFSFILISSQ